MRVFARVLLGIFLALIGACGVLIWHQPTRYVSTSPDGEYSIRVTEKCALADCRVNVYERGAWMEHVIQQGNDSWLGFIHVTWIGPVAVGFADGGPCPDLKFAYDFRAGRLTSYAQFEDQLKQDIIRAWNVTPAELQDCGGDVFRWADPQARCAGSRALRDFQVRYPQAGTFF